jgi:glycerophosphoryl diester phosphodiesterase
MTQLQPKGFHPWHKPHWASYMVENSLSGIRMAARAGRKRIDLDVNFTLDGVAVVGHWDDLKKDHFIIPDELKKKYGTVKISTITWEELQTLHTKPIKFKGVRRIYRHISALEAAKTCAAYGIYPAFEIKGGYHSMQAKSYVKLKNDLKKAGINLEEVYWMTLQDLGDPKRRLMAMSEAGLSNKMLLSRGFRGVPVSWEPYIDYVRGRWKRNFSQ